ncbi:alpha/beta hydrolase [Rhizobium sp. DKSPLA3]|uniref:Alpha/beta hydrolase n=1 Tax=Rhizobium quercicola TaxID=2901226 RepID=A0A9X1T5J8_9HYPH|nr:alpha/beta hydrolase [Rhizobium quercicola]
MITVLLIALAGIVSVFIATIAILAVRSAPEDLRSYDVPSGTLVMTDQASLAAYTEMATAFADMGKAFDAMPEAERLATVRAALDGMGEAKSLEETVVPVDAEGVSGEWVLPAHGRVLRKILYIHGGFFSMGSPVSHRAMTTRLARECDAAVFAPRYALLPENPRKRMVGDCRRAYAWLAAAPVPGWPTMLPITVAGDSAGGNLALVTARWASRQTGLDHPASVVALSPATDATMSSLTRANRKDDILVGPTLDPVLKLAPLVWRLAILAKFKVWPNDPEISPLFGDLSRLPPTFIQVGSSELMLGDSLRYANKARAQGSDVRLQRWTGLPHVWHLMDLDAEAARQSWQAIAAFISDPAGASSGPRDDDRDAVAPFPDRTTASSTQTPLPKALP